MEKMDKFNIYYYGVDRGHRGSFGTSDSTLVAVITTLTPDEVKEEFKIYCDVDKFSELKIDYEHFIKKLAEDAHLYDDAEDDAEPVMSYPCFYFDCEGRYWLPDFDSCFNHMIDEDYDITKLLNPEEVLGKENFKKLCSKIEDNKNNKIDREEKYEEFKKIKDKIVKKFLSQLEEFEEYYWLERRWGKLEEPIRRSGESIKGYIKELGHYEKYLTLRKTWENAKVPEKPDLTPHYPKGSKMKMVRYLWQVEYEKELETKIRELGLQRLLPAVKIGGTNG